jgi:hypothetical protein
MRQLERRGWAQRGTGDVKMKPSGDAAAGFRYRTRPMGKTIAPASFPMPERPRRIFRANASCVYGLPGN